MIKPVSLNSHLAATQQKAAAELEQSSFEQVLNKTLKAEDDKRLKEACQELESVFMHQVLSALRSTVPPNPLLGRSQAEEIFQSMLDQEITKSAAKTSSIGLAEMLFKQLKPNLETERVTQSEDNSSLDNTKTRQQESVHET